MKTGMWKALLMVLCLAGTFPVMAQFNLKKAISGAAKTVQAATLTDEQMAEYVKEYIDWMDEHNQVCADDNPYTVRLKKLTEGLSDADGIELLGVIGHEIGHIAHRDSKKGFRTALLTSALKDGISSKGGKAAALTESQLGELGEALVNARYSQKQERDADDYGYEFLKKCGKNPWAMALSFQKLKSLQEEAGAGKTSKLNQLFSTHPDLDARIQRMEERATADGIEKPENKKAEE